jgi:EAL domain-containing protein (putative c-di-GMP-specific phosphodiesterase class I)
MMHGFDIKVFRRAAGRSLSIDVVAEGIETEAQLVLVRAAGCTHGQGYLFGRPCPASQLDFAHFVKCTVEGAAA